MKVTRREMKRRNTEILRDKETDPDITQAELAEKYGLNQSQVSRILKRAKE